MQHVDKLLLNIWHEVQLTENAGTVRYQIHRVNVLYTRIVCAVLNQCHVVAQVIAI